VELLTSLAVVVSRLGWVSAQLVALGLTFNVLSGGHGGVAEWLDGTKK